MRESVSQCCDPRPQTRTTASRRYMSGWRCAQWVRRRSPAGLRRTTRSEIAFGPRSPNERGTAIAERGGEVFLADAEAESFFDEVGNRVASMREVLTPIFNELQLDLGENEGSYEFEATRYVDLLGVRAAVRGFSYRVELAEGIHTSSRSGTPQALRSSSFAASKRQCQSRLTASSTTPTSPASRSTRRAMSGGGRRVLDRQFGRRLGRASLGAAKSDRAKQVRRGPRFRRLRETAPEAWTATNVTVLHWRALSDDQGLLISRRPVSESEGRLDSRRRE
jgi:hypothetical protein